MNVKLPVYIYIYKAAFISTVPPWSDQLLPVIRYRIG